MELQCVAVAYPDPYSHSSGWITSPLRESGSGKMLVPSAPDFRRTTTMQSTRDVTFGAALTRNYACQTTTLMLLSYVPGQDWATQPFVQTSTKLYKALEATCLSAFRLGVESRFVTWYCHSFLTASINVLVASL